MFLLFPVKSFGQSSSTELFFYFLDIDEWDTNEIIIYKDLSFEGPDVPLTKEIENESWIYFTTIEVNLSNQYQYPEVTGWHFGADCESGDGPDPFVPYVADLDSNSQPD